jgi:hypothetical protein
VTQIILEYQEQPTQEVAEVLEEHFGLLVFLEVALAVQE